MFPLRERVSAIRLYRLPSSGQRNTAAGILVGSLVGVLGALLLVLWGGTQWAAWKLIWELRYGQVAAMKSIWRTGHWLIGVPPI